MGFFSFALALTLSLSNANAPTPQASLQPCELPRLTGPARCGVLEVFEDRAQGLCRRGDRRVPGRRLARRARPELRRALGHARLPL